MRLCSVEKGVVPLPTCTTSPLAGAVLGEVVCSQTVQTELEPLHCSLSLIYSLTQHIKIEW